MNIQGRTLEEAIKRWKAIPDFMDDQKVHHGEDKREIANYLFDFHCYYGCGGTKAYTSKEHKTEHWIDQVDRCELDLVSPRVVYWTTRGRVTRIKLLLLMTRRNWTAGKIGKLLCSMTTIS